MLLSRQILPDDLRQEYKESCYDIIGCIHYVHKTLGPAMVEYVYQEALYKTLLKKGYNVIKEYNVSGDNVAHYNLPAEQQAAIERHLDVHSFPTYKLFNREGQLLDLNVDARELDTLARLLDQMK